jgi:glucose/arabinose dehydrogenase
MKNRFLMKKISLLLLVTLGTQLFAQTYSLSTYCAGFTNPITLAQAPGDDRLYVVEQPGRIKIINTNGVQVPGNWLDITSIVYDNGNEQGLLGLAFPDDYQTTGYFYVYYTIDSAGTSADGDNRVSRFSRSTINPLLADPASEVVLYTVSDPYSNHNGGCLQFGPDGYLYVSMGDGGSGGDPGNLAQNNNNYLGKMHRINVNNVPDYTIPASNPFYGVAGYVQSIWSKGVRNIWKFSFDRITGDLWMGDVGQDAHEEINHQLASSPGGENYGWRCYEGMFAYNTVGCQPQNTYNSPIADIPQSTGPMCSVTGGEVYRGAMWNDLYNKYFFTDYCNDYFWTITYDTTAGGTYDTTRHNNLSGSHFFVTLNQDNRGYIYAADISNGTIYRLNSSNCQPAAVIEAPSNVTTICDGGAVTLVSAPGTGLTYQWIFAGLPIPGANDSTYIATVPGNYQLVVSKASCVGTPNNTSAVYTLTTGTTPAVTLTATTDTACASQTSVAFTGTPAGGSYISPYVNSGGSFFVQVAGLGNHEVVYRYQATPGGCIGYDTLEITVNSGPAVSFASATDTVCSSGASFALSGGSPAGGTYSGSGVSGGNFDPSVGVGNYTVTYTYTDGAGCTNTATDNIVVSGCLGLEDFSFNDIVLYPNPADEMVNLTISANIPAQFNMNLLTVDGKLVQQKNIQVGIGSNSFVINTSALAPGIYFVQLNDGLHSFTKKIVIQ